MRGSGSATERPELLASLLARATEIEREPGSGRRTGWLSNLHLGARDPTAGLGTAGLAATGPATAGLATAGLG